MSWEKVLTVNGGKVHLALPRARSLDCDGTIENHPTLWV
jgi:hypothetical protein